ncbi:hypothetical protein BHE74_00029073 [Ensete ventricosum]|nr:hypothetical protein GW17_00043327 [Ensete ventricosum]RWW63727.1 hypothetical protein BHE74_00029073 [Ensete ventricosum]RZS05644.1 hypothetical protein BHM03_00036180 [Ensete ventricosum]
MPNCYHRHSQSYVPLLLRLANRRKKIIPIQRKMGWLLMPFCVPQGPQNHNVVFLTHKSRTKKKAYNIPPLISSSGNKKRHIVHQHCEKQEPLRSRTEEPKENPYQNEVIGASRQLRGLVVLVHDVAGVVLAHREREKRKEEISVDGNRGKHGSRVREEEEEEAGRGRSPLLLSCIIVHHPPKARRLVHFVAVTASGPPSARFGGGARGIGFEIRAQVNLEKDQRCTILPHRGRRHMEGGLRPPVGPWKPAVVVDMVEHRYGVWLCCLPLANYILFL